jgi:hypothetical protein
MYKDYSLEEGVLEESGFVDSDDPEEKEDSDEEETYDSYDNESDWDESE